MTDAIVLDAEITAEDSHDVAESGHELAAQVEEFPASRIFDTSGFEENHGDDSKVDTGND